MCAARGVPPHVDGVYCSALICAHPRRSALIWMDGVDRLQVMTLIAKALGSSILSGNSGSGSVQIVKILKVGLPTVPPPPASRQPQPTPLHSYSSLICFL